MKTERNKKLTSADQKKTKENTTKKNAGTTSDSSDGQTC